MMLVMGATACSPRAGDGSARGSGSAQSPRLNTIKQQSMEKPTPKAAADLLAAYAATDRFRSGTPIAITPTPDGSAVLFLRTAEGTIVRDLYEFDCASGESRLLLTAAELLEGKDEILTPEEQARRERMRMNSRGISSFSLSKDGSKILVPLSDRLFVVDRGTRVKREVTGASGFPYDARFSPDGRLLAAVRNDEVMIHDLAAGRWWTATTGAGGEITNGTAEFVAQEEMGRFRGYWFSPDCKYLCYQQTDNEGVETFYIGDPSDPAKAPQTWPYPRAGKKNAAVKLAITPIVEGKVGEAQWIDWDREKYPYLATVTWEKNSPLTLLVQNRNQTEQVLLAVNVETGATTALLTERDPTWINIYESCPKWLEDGSGFLWVSEQYEATTPPGTDFARLELRNRDGSLRSVITPPGYPFINCLSLDDAGGKAYISTSAVPTQLHGAVVSLDAPGRAPELLNQGPGIYSQTFSKDNRTYVESSATLNGEPAWVVKTNRNSTWKTIGEIPSVAEVPGVRPNVELTSVRAANGLEYYASIVRPRAFKAGERYPVIVSVYGGPAAPSVDSSSRRYLLHQYYAEHGFIVVAIDNRGTQRRGRAWERAIKNNFIQTPLEDQTTVLSLLGKKYPELDLQHVGIFGWSFGGYFSAMAAMQRPDIYRCAIAGAPVCSWEDYDTHYTERYLGLPQENARGYKDSDVLTYCEDLRVPFMLIHGTADDNVYFVHSLKLAKKLFDSSRNFEFIPLSGFTHMVNKPEAVVQLHTRQVRFFQRVLMGSGQGNFAPGER